MFACLCVCQSQSISSFTSFWAAGMLLDKRTVKIMKVYIERNILFTIQLNGAPACFVKNCYCCVHPITLLRYAYKRTLIIMEVYI